jgi:hypothetical protein
MTDEATLLDIAHDFDGPINRIRQMAAVLVSLEDSPAGSDLETLHFVSESLSNIALDLEAGRARLLHASRAGQL